MEVFVQLLLHAAKDTAKVALAPNLDLFSVPSKAIIFHQALLFKNTLTNKQFMN